MQCRSSPDDHDVVTREACVRLVGFHKQDFLFLTGKVMGRESKQVSTGDRLFQVVGPLTAKLRCPVAVRARGTSRVAVVADRSCCRPRVEIE